MLKRFIGLVGGAVLLAGCGAATLNELRGTTPEGTDFTKALTAEYLTFAEYEYETMMDRADGAYFAEKGLMAAKGEVVAPEDPANWNTPEDAMDELVTQRARLVAALDNGGRDNFPMEAATAQAKYDCWVEQQEENFQPGHIAVCKEEFMAAMEKLEGMQAPVAQAPQPANFIVFFDFDDGSVNDGAMGILRLVAGKHGMTNGSIILSGHTDTAGSVEYNQALALTRANAVRDALIDMGVPGGDFAVSARGESDPLEATGDGVRNPTNRRVEITVLP